MCLTGSTYDLKLQPAVRISMLEQTLALTWHPKAIKCKSHGNQMCTHIGLNSAHMDQISARLDGRRHNSTYPLALVGGAASPLPPLHASGNPLARSPAPSPPPAVQVDLRE